MISHKKILLIEDALDNTVLIKFFLEQQHANVVCVENGRDALNELNKNNFDLILMDMQMPIMDGYQAAQLLRARGLKTPIIAITANNNPDDRKKCLHAGCSDFISKPFSKKLLIERILHHLH